MARKLIRRVKLATLLIVGEGPIDKAFLKHMKRLYDGRTGQKVTIYSGDGGSPHDLIVNTKRQYQHAAFDRKFILLDEDVTIPEQDRKTARIAGIKLIVSTPVCLEGMLLSILEKKVPNTNKRCKNILHPKLSGPPTEPNSYQQLFPKDLLDSTLVQPIVQLKSIIEYNL